MACIASRLQTTISFPCRDLYLTYLLMLCESFNYFSLSLLFVLYLTQEFGVGDVEASHPTAHHVALTTGRLSLSACMHARSAGTCI